jgi:hypothetical protein
MGILTIFYSATVRRWRMEKEKQDSKEEKELITRKEAFQKMGKYAAYSAAIVAVLFAAPDKSQAGS